VLCLRINCASRRLMLLAFRILLGVAGILFLALGLFIYEDEERQVQSRLENYWVWLDDHRLKSYATEHLWWARLSAMMTQTLDTLFGQTIVSLQAFLVSISLSMASAVVLALVHGPLLIAAAALVVLIFATCFAMVSRRFPLLGLALWSIIPGCVGGLLIDFFKSSVIGSLVAAGCITLSIVTDLVLIAAIRLLFRQASRIQSSIRVLCYFALLIGGGIVLCFGPLYIAMRTVQNGEDIRDIRFLYAAFLFYLNGADIFLFALFLLIAAIFVGHHLLWPVMQRPLYAIQRSAILERKKMTSSVGVAMISAALALKEAWIAPVIETLIKRFGG
jgi:hypothetical protein